MSTLFKGLDPRGRRIYTRRPFDARAYTADPRWVPELRASYGQYGTRELLADPQGPFGGFSRRGVVDRGGQRFEVLQRSGTSPWVLEVELTDHKLGEIRELPADEAWAVARAGDARFDPPIEIEVETESQSRSAARS